jgi:hypothetical protein
MNIQNIAALAEQLQLLGFENAGYSLLKRICFKPDAFFISHKIEKGKDQLSFQLLFEKASKQNGYVLMYYDAILQKEMTLPDATINGINTVTLEKRMAEMDWKGAFDFDIKKQWSVDDKTSWDKELKVESVIEDLLELESVEEGKVIAVGLKLKYWNGVPYQELVGNINHLKNKSEVSQRFYFFEGQAGISVDEAYRFLQNRWLEKQIHSKRKQTDEISAEENHAGDQASADSGLLRKKRISKRSGVKNNK